MATDDLTGHKSIRIHNKWIIGFGTFWINLFIFSAFRSSGVLYLALLEEFRCNHYEASWPGTLASSIASVTCLPAGFLTHFLKVRTIVTFGVILASVSISICVLADHLSFIIISFGLIQGIGLGFVTGLLPVIINDHFGPQDRTTMVGVSYGGAAIGAFIFPLLFQYLVSNFMLNQTLLIMGCVTGLSILGSIVLFPPSPVTSTSSPSQLESGDEEAKRKSMVINTVNEVDNNNTVLGHIERDLKILTDGHFLLITTSYTCYIMCNVSLLMILPDYCMTALGQSKDDSVLLLSLFAITDLIGRLIAGPTIRLIPWITQRSLFMGSLIVMSGCHLMLPNMNMIPQAALWPALVMITLTCGLMAGFQMILPPVLITQYMGPHNTAVAFGLCNFISGIINFTRPFIIGYIKETTGEYVYIFYLFGSLTLISSLSWVVQSIYQRPKKEISTPE